MIYQAVNFRLASFFIPAIVSAVRMTDIRNNNPWPRLIALMDMNAFFASIEQRDHPGLYAGRPIGVTNGMTGTTIITASYEARQYGVRTGMKVKDALRRCPRFLQVAARPERYAEVSTAIMLALQEEVAPDVEIFSCDEAFLDLTTCQLIRNPYTVGILIKDIVKRVSGLTCSVGISGDKTTAKFAAKQKKPDGLTIIPPWEAGERLRDVPVTELCGIKDGIGGFLAARGVYKCGDITRIPMSALTARFGPLGGRIWYMCQGLDPSPVETVVKPPKSVGHGKVMPPDTRDRDVLLTYLIHMGEKVGARLRAHGLAAQKFFIGLRTWEGWIGSNKLKSKFPTNDSRIIHKLSRIILDTHWHGQGIHQVQITALDPRPETAQGDLFAENGHKSNMLNQAIDKINGRYGEFTIAPAILLERSDMPNVIAPAWKPYGHSQTIVPTVEQRKQTGKVIEPALDPDYAEYLLACADHDAAVFRAASAGPEMELDCLLSSGE
jgi:DNA polymerase-4